MPLDCWGFDVVATMPARPEVEADAGFVIGAGHRVCQDYATARPSSDAGPALAIVSDGCSSSPDTDIGSRILARLAATCLQDPSMPSTAFTPQKLGAASLESMAPLGLSPLACDATLLWAREQADGVDLGVFGDGLIATRSPDGSLSLWSVDADDAPPYPSVMSDPDRRAAREARHGFELRVEVDGSGFDQRVPAAVGLRQRWSWDEIDLVALCSDGVASFRARAADALERGTCVEPRRILEVLLDFKSTRGAFVQRRLHRFIHRECPARQWVPHDDVALAVLVKP